MNWILLNMEFHPVECRQWDVYLFILTTTSVCHSKKRRRKNEDEGLEELKHKCRLRVFWAFFLRDETLTFYRQDVNKCYYTQGRKITWGREGMQGGWWRVVVGCVSVCRLLKTTKVCSNKENATYYIVCVCVCVRACMRACVRACVRVCVCKKIYVSGAHMMTNY